ncbi:hypothetical protein C4D60_Mb01t18510 [Musa balbisiana]|uniref:Uncharacterized protein n=1 Tax=Musa balbisiana TaxID=52838 RepID=A0A4S8JN42_MUSBA|nr:hypothetical protein C4D60_Mb01t18510 [Musa balbisiana]
MFVMLTAYDTDDSCHLVICITLQTPSGKSYIFAGAHDLPDRIAECFKPWESIFIFKSVKSNQLHQW